MLQKNFILWGDIYTRKYNTINFWLIDIWTRAVLGLTILLIKMINMVISSILTEREIQKYVVKIITGMVATHFKFICVKDRFFIIRNIYCIFMHGIFMHNDLWQFCRKRTLFLVLPFFLLCLTFTSSKTISSCHFESDERNWLQVFRKRIT